jgi:DNA polymerase delta subunit 1
MSKVLKTIKGIETFEKLEDVYSYLRKDVKYKEKKIEIVYNQETKEYIIEIYNEKETNYEKEIDINVDMEVVYGDTDSIMIRMKYNRDDFIQNRKDSFKLGEECARILTDDIFNRKPIEMEAENIYNPFIMLTRKRYTAKKYEDPENVLKTKGIITKGLATTRRDYSPMIQKCLKSIIEEIMKTEGKPSMKQKVIKDSINIYLETLENIKNNKVPLIDIVTSATLKKTYKNENLPHVNLYKKLKDRKEEVQIGDRIQFVFIEDLTNTKAKNELAEDPKYVERNGLNINRYFYTEKLAKVILGFYKSILTQEQLNEILEITNTYIESYSGKCLKEKDFEVD